jgi:hypothetical protein
VVDSLRSRPLTSWVVMCPSGSCSRMTWLFVVEPVREAAAFGVVVFGLPFLRMVDEAVVVHAVRSSRGDDPAFDVVGDVDTGGAAVLPVVEPAFPGVCVVEFAAEQAVHIAERPKGVVAVADKRFAVAIPCYCFEVSFRRGPDDENLTVAVRDAAQMVVLVEEVDAIVVSVFDCRQTADMGMAFRGFEDQGLLITAVEEAGPLPRASQVIMSSPEVAGVEFRAFPQGILEHFAFAVFEVGGRLVGEIHQSLGPVADPAGAEDACHRILAGVSAGKPERAAQRDIRNRCERRNNCRRPG